MSGHKYIQKPLQLVMVDGQSWDFGRFVSWLLDKDHPRFNADRAGGLASSRIAEELEKHDQVMKLTVEDCELLVHAASGPLQLVPGTGQFLKAYPTTVSRIWMRFVDAIVSAKDEPPAKDAA